MMPSTRATLQDNSAFLGMWGIYGLARRSPKMSQNQPKLKVIIHSFGLSQCPNSESQGMPTRGMRGHWKGVMWLGTNI